MAAQRTYLAIDLKSFYASVECVDRHLDPLTTNLVVADASRTEKTICLAVSPSLKAYKIPGRARLFEAVQRDESGEAYDVVAGTFLVVGLSEEDFAFLSPELTQKYEELFHQPETFMRLGRQMLVLPVPDENVRTEIAKAKPPAAHER